MAPSGAPHTVRANATLSDNGRGVETIALQDVVLGDVYVCSGQSNMDFAVPMGFNASAEGAAADAFPDIRLMTVQKCGGGGPHACNNTGPGLEFQNGSFVGQRWVRSSRESVYGAAEWTRSDYAGWEAKIGQVGGGRGFSAACYFFGRELYQRRRYPIGLVWASIGGSGDSAWMPAQAFEACELRPRAAIGWDVMVAPLTQSSIAGAVWYQGESDEHDPGLYNCTFPAMVAAWRAAWHNNTRGATDALFPFGVVQLSVHGGYPCYGTQACYGMPTWSTGYAAVRWAQTASTGTAPNAALPNVFMATAVDLGEPFTPAGGPHVRDKQDIGQRLALAFRDQFVPGDGPFFTPGAVASTATATPAAGGLNSTHMHAVNMTSVAVTFTNLPPGAQPLLPPSSALGLEVSPDDAWDTLEWRNVTAASVEGGVVTLMAPLSRVSQVRYLWSDNACLGWNSSTASRETDSQFRCPLYTSRGLPALPFILNVSTQL